jgi:UDP-glucuronate 4-epimerase
VEDIAEALARLIPKPAQPNPVWDGSSPDIATSSAPYRVYNIGNAKPVLLESYIEAIEDALGKKAIREYLPMQPGDVPATHADTEALYTEIAFKPTTTIQAGVSAFVKWYLEEYKQIAK